MSAQLREMKPAIDNKEPRGFGGTTKDGKKKFLMVRDLEEGDGSKKWRGGLEGR